MQWLDLIIIYIVQQWIKLVAHNLHKRCWLSYSCFFCFLHGADKQKNYSHMLENFHPIQEFCPWLLQTLVEEPIKPSMLDLGMHQYLATLT